MQPIIYLTVNVINSKVYIGSTIRPENCKYLGSGVLILKAIKKYGKHNFVRITLEKVTIETKQSRETFWINFFQTYESSTGYNLSKSGVGPTKPHSDSIKNRIRISNTGKKRTKEQCYNISKGKVGKKQTSEHTEKIANIKRGSLWSDYQKQRHSELKRGKKLSTYHIQKIIDAKSTPEYFFRNREAFKVLQFDKNKNLIKTWDNLYEIKKYYATWNISYIEDNIENKRNSAYKFIWTK